MQVGDLVQWTCNGQDVFPEPKKISHFSDCRQFLFVEGSVCGIPIQEVHLTTPEKFTLFWRSSSPFSQWYPCHFRVGSREYSSAEQFMMASKARLFGDEIILNRILRADNPSIQKRLGKAVHGFDQQVWDAAAKKIVYQGNHAKFTQNPNLLTQLLETKGTTLVEASPYDVIWGVGLDASDPAILDRGQWRGLNWLGEVLTQLREDLLNQISI